MSLFGRLWPRSAARSTPAASAAATIAESDPLRRYGALCRAAGFDRLSFALSFDCDTPEDAAAAAEIEPWLRELGIKTTYAVPGAQLERGAATYRLLAEGGTEFMNHGGRAHADRGPDGLYFSITFYDRLSSEEVVADMLAGHHIVERVIGVAPKGFRAPHFGSFQAPLQRELLYGTARRLGYHYCSGTLPEFGVENGPVVPVGGLMELPLTGSRRNPGVILDSWNYFYTRRRLEDEFAECMIETVDWYESEDLPALINVYVDPAHVAGATPFRRAITHLVRRGARSLALSELARMRPASSRPVAAV